MRLLHRLPNGEFGLKIFDDEQLPEFAILSHTWVTDEEVTYAELLNGSGKHKSGYNKILFCYERALVDKLQFFWIDTCCIDKSEIQEVSVAINSMYRWYKASAKCYVYLTDVAPATNDLSTRKQQLLWIESFKLSRWHTRGWCLQELLAPAFVEFYTRDGTMLGTKASLSVEIHEVTGIPIKAVHGQNLAGYTVREKLSWTDTRTTTRVEDMAYCLLGIFGVSLPLNYGEGKEYAFARLKEEIQKAYLKELGQDLQLLAVNNSLPFPQNDDFVGRREQLKILEQYMFMPDKHQRISICGLGGCGKSALVLQLAYLALLRGTKAMVFWVAAISQETFELAYQSIALRLGISGTHHKNIDVKNLVRDALSKNLSNLPWLMIVDNADDSRVLLNPLNSDPSSVRLFDCLPQSKNGTILFTTRTKRSAEDLTPGKIMELNKMGKSEAEQLFLRNLTNPLVLDDEAAMDELLKELCYLPLAIVQATAFLNKNNMPIASYLYLLKTAGADTELFSEEFRDNSRYEELDRTIAKTWHISFDQISHEDPLAAEYLSFLASIGHTSVPESLLPVWGSPVQQKKALGTLSGYAFISFQHTSERGSEERRLFDMHRLVHLASVLWLQRHKQQKKWVNIAVDRLVEILPHGTQEEKPLWRTYLPHAIHTVGLDVDVNEKARATLLNRIGWCQTALGMYTAAETTHRQELALRIEQLELDHPDTLAARSALAVALKCQGRYAEAEVLDRETLTKRTALLGPEHSSTLQSTCNLASVLDKLGKYAESETLQRTALRCYETTLGPTHRETLIVMNNLCINLSDQCKYEAAESLNRDTLLRLEGTLGPQHADTVINMTALARVLRLRYKYSEAERINRRALSLAELDNVFGPEHPTTTIIMDRLAETLIDQSKNAEAEDILRELKKRREALGPQHPDMLRTMECLALVVAYRGRAEEAEALTRETLARQSVILGPEHSDTLMNVYCLARWLAMQYRFDEARVEFERAREGLVKVLGCEHQRTRLCEKDFAAMLEKQEFLEKRRGRSDAAQSRDDGSTLWSAASLPSRRERLSRGLAKISLRSLSSRRSEKSGKSSSL